MFVSPPPATSTVQILQMKHSKRNKSGSNLEQGSHYRNDIENNINSNHLSSIPEENNYYNNASHNGSSSTVESQGYLIQQQQQNQMNLSANSRKNKTNFVSAPPEYADRARLEIRKRLLPSHNKKSIPTNNTTNHNSDNHPRSSISTGTISNNSSIQDNHSLVSDNASSYQSSIFSHPSTVVTETTNDSLPIIPKYVTEITLEDALPKTFYDMYPPEVLMSDPSNLFYNGRPKFTKRELLDWDLNDIRSLLIVEKLRPEWGNQLPTIIATNGMNVPQFRLQLLPLRSMDNFIIKTLVESDLYLEANLDYEFKVTSAKYTVASARKRHEQITGLNEPIMNLSKPEWRNIIENYLLNIAVEAQCRFDFKQRCSEFKKWKLQQSNLKKPDMPPPSLIPRGSSSSAGKGNGINPSSNNLLKKALMKNMQMKNLGNGQEQQPSINKSMEQQNVKISLTKEEKANIWSHCQAQVYQRLGLDWQPDGVLS
ncbi:Std1p NDAI_0F00690 [Naumovozyma dairenensis CBS 421]|uniref:Uncharacterized protein n=1 Tax=Naumovozyma dairenensis (strain ATCC 10597 / BCRC 20456 / CBS 421 / NBRC 0211 / NRRL Y-12639) TaxID=1071378 RepID=G0WC77_NAUDC|nr:hypothetical protein NDAI_0F00690 [Naumovozyma dairenensis CBS 421]CCD25388.1 hypothetical protein NDAI_0F00690 [Naumovozyma dairenensis CBS 421]